MSAQRPSGVEGAGVAASCVVAGIRVTAAPGAENTTGNCGVPSARIAVGVAVVGFGALTWDADPMVGGTAVEGVVARVGWDTVKVGDPREGVAVEEPDAVRVGS